MKIAVSGSQNCGKTTFIEEFKKRWPMYVSPEHTYRDIIKQNPHMGLNKGATVDSQHLILEALIVEAKLAKDTKHVIFDRCVIDNLAYSLWLNAHEKIEDDYITDIKYKIRDALSLYDIIFYLPLHKDIPLVERETRDLDPVFRTEVDYIFKALVSSYETQADAFFPVDSSPAVITLDGPPDMRVEQARLYIKENGNSFAEEDGSLLS